MRIISGKFKGRSLVVPKNFRGRPTTDFAREGLFNVLQNLVDLQGISVLDLFAGTGAFGIECYSRGAGRITSVDVQPLHVKFISENFRHFEISQGRTVRQDVFRFLEQDREKYDLIFADPPFDIEELEGIPDLVFNSGKVAAGGMFILEHGKRNDFSNHPKFLQQRKYSNVHFSFFGDES